MNSGTAYELSRVVMEREPGPIDQMVFAEALYRNGQTDEAIVELVALRHDGSAPKSARNEAFALSARLASEAFDFQALRRVCSEWFEFDPADKRAAWNLVHSLLRLGRSEQAFDVAERTRLEPETIDQAELLAAVLDANPDSEEAARAIR